MDVDGEIARGGVVDRALLDELVAVRGVASTRSVVESLTFVVSARRTVGASQLANEYYSQVWVTLRRVWRLSFVDCRGFGRSPLVK